VSTPYNANRTAGQGGRCAGDSKQFETT
jgi:hypothetical protein